MSLANGSSSSFQSMSITFTDAFWDEFLQLPRNTCKKVIQTFKILENDPIFARGKAEKVRGTKDNKYRISIGNYRLIYSFDQEKVKIFSVRKRNERTYKSI